jgi:beta-galactosidase
MWKLFGTEIKSYDLPMPHSPGKVNFENREIPWTSWGDLLNPFDGTETWATYQGDFYAGTPAVVHHKLGKGTVTYIGVDSHNGDLEKLVMTKLCKQQGIEIENYPEGILVEYRDGFGIAMNYSDKEFEMNLPEGAEILIGKKTLKTAGVLVWKIK